MGDYDNLEIQGEEREQALREVLSQIGAWNLSMPEAPPLLLHFGLGRFREVGETEFWIANDLESRYCGKYLFVFDGQTCPYHYHRQKHETFFVVKGAVVMRVGDAEKLLREGETLVMPPGVGHSFTGSGPALILEVSMPCLLNDNFFRDRSIGRDGVV